MKRLPRLVSVMVGTLALVWGMGGAAVPAEAASGGSVYVGLPGGGCPRSGRFYPDVNAALAAGSQPSKITVCPGVYPSFTVDGKSNLKIMGKGQVLILPDSSPFSGPLVHVRNSRNVTIQGLTINGMGAFDGNPGYGIWFENSSGSIQKNIVTGISELPIDTYSAVDYVGIYVTGSGGQKVVVRSNTVQDFEWNGIDAVGNVHVQITKNKVIGGVWASFPPPCSCGADAPTGIAVENIGGASSIKGNVVQSNFNFSSSVGGNTSFGIVVFQSSGVTVMTNKLTDLAIGIYVLDFGTRGTGIGASQNKLTSNTITDSYIGIGVRADDNSLLSPLAGARTNGNVLKTNKITINDTFSYGAGILLMLDEDPADDPIVAVSSGNVIMSNVLSGYTLLGGAIEVDPGVVHTAISSNKTNLQPKPGAAPAAPFDSSTLPLPSLTSVP